MGFIPIKSVIGKVIATFPTYKK
ncbi:hypothetical protein [Mucilaginibacter sp. KACC 22063]